MRPTQNARPRDWLRRGDVQLEEDCGTSYQLSLGIPPMQLRVGTTAGAPQECKWGVRAGPPLCLLLGAAGSLLTLS